jgi:mannose-6-phosphate isomerase-like protein (cupin superfamily)
MKSFLPGRALAAAGLAAACLLGGRVAAEDAAPPTLDALYPSGRLTLPFAELILRVALAPGEPQRVVELARDAGTSQHLVAIRGQETPHRHDRHDLLVVMLRGHGRMRIRADERAVGEGSILYVPRGSVHAFRNEAAEPAIAFAVYMPAFDPRDRVTVP